MWVSGLANFFAYCLLLGVAGEFQRRAMWGFLIVGILMPVLLTQKFLDNIDQYPEPSFFWVKLISVVIAGFLTTLFRYSYSPGAAMKPIPKAVAFYTTIALMALNIAEACITDLKNENYLNCFAGLFVIIGLPFDSAMCEIGGGEFTDFTCSLNYDPWQQGLWNWGYTLWNASFVLSNVGYARPLAHLVAPMLFAGAWKPELWMQNRLYMLLANMIALGAIGEDALRADMPLLDGSTDDQLIGLSLVSLVFNFVSSVYLRATACFVTPPENEQAVKYSSSSKVDSAVFIEDGQ